MVDIIMSKRVSLLSSVLGSGAQAHAPKMKTARDPRSQQAVRRLAADAVEMLEEAGRVDNDKRDSILNKLSEDLIGPIADDVRDFFGPSDVQRRETPSAASTSAAVGDSHRPEFFFEVLAAYYGDTDAVEPSYVKGVLLPVFRRCMGSPSLAMILALLLHRRLLDSPTSFGRYDYIWACRMLLDGTDSLLWMDLSSRSHRFSSLHSRFRCWLEAEGFHVAQARGLREECGLMFWRFSFYYYEAQEVVDILNDNPAEVCVCLNALASQMRTISIESVLLDYLTGCQLLVSVRNMNRLAGPLVSLRFQRSLYLLSQPGGPCYPPASVRKSAFRCLNTLYPEGRVLRTVFTSLLRFTYPYYNIKAAVDAIMGFVHTCAMAVFGMWAFVLSAFSTTIVQITNALGSRQK